MPDTVTQPVTGQQRVLTDLQLKQEEMARVDRRNWNGGAEAALASAPTQDIVDFFTESAFTPEPSFKWTKPLLEEMSDGIPSDMIHLFGNATSLDHAYYIRAKLQRKTDHREALSSLGYYGTGLVAAANLVDPTMLLAGVASGGVSEFAAAANATRMARMMRAGIATGGTFAMLDAARSTVNPDIGGWEVAAAGLAGLGLGAAGPIARNAGRARSIVAHGAGAAAGPFAVENIHNAVSEDEQRASVWWNAGTNFIMGGLLSQLSPAARKNVDPELLRANAAVERAAVNMQKDAEFKAVSESGATLLPKGQEYFRDQGPDQTSRLEPVLRPLEELQASIDDAIEAAAQREYAPRFAQEQAAMVRRAEYGAAVQRYEDAFKIAERRLDGDSILGAEKFPDGHRLNRSEMDAILEGTGYKLGKDSGQGATIEEFRAKLRDLRDYGGLRPTEAAPPVAEPVIPEQQFGVYGAAPAKKFNPLSVFHLDGSDHIVRTKAKEAVAEAAAKPKTTPVSKSKLQGIASAAAERIKKRQTKRGSRSGSGTIIEDSGDSAIWAAAKIADGTLKGTESIVSAIAREFPHLADKAAVIADQAIALGSKPENLKHPAEVGDFDFSNVTDARGATVKLWKVKFPRLGMGARINRDATSLIRKAGNIFAKDGLPREDGSPSPFSAAEAVAAKTAAATGELVSKTRALYDEHVAANGSKAMSRIQWNEAVTKLKRRVVKSGVPAGTDPTLAKAAQFASKFMADKNKFAMRHEVDGFEKIHDTLDHVPRIYEQGPIDRDIERFGLDQFVEKLWSKAIKGGDRVTSDRDARAMARAILRNGGRGDVPTALSRGKMFADDPEKLTQALKLEAVAEKLSDEDIAGIVRRMTDKQEDADNPSVAKKRVDMDETFAADLIDKKTGQTVRVSIEDYLNNNIESLLAHYSHQVYGAAAFRRGMEALWPGNPPKDITQALQRLYIQASDEGNSSKSIANIKRLEAVMKLVTGVPLHDSHVAREAMRSLSNLAYTHTMAGTGTGIQNMTEISHGMSELGFASVLKEIPGAMEIYSRAASGDMPTPRLRELEAIGLGLDRVLHRMTPDRVQDAGVDGLVAKTNNVTGKMARFASDVSLQSFGQEILESVIGLTIQQKWADMSRGVGSKIGKFRLAASGLSPEMADRIAAAMRDPEHGVKYEQDGTTLFDLNVQNWPDTEAASAFRASTAKMTKRLALKMDQTEMELWMHSDTGKFLTFLRKFYIGSYENKTLFAIQAKDGLTAKFFVSSILASSLGYTARVYLQSIGRPDADEYREKYLSMDAIAKNSFARSSLSSFIPAIADTGAQFLGLPEQFSGSRSSGQRQSLLGGNPMLNMLSGASQIPSAILGPILWDDYDFSKNDLNNINDGLAIPNITGVRAILENIGLNLPKRSTKQ